MRFFLGGDPSHEFTGDHLALIESLRELLGCQVDYLREAPAGVRWVEDPAHPASGYEQHKPITNTVEVVGSRLGGEAVAALIRHELARLGHPEVTVQPDT